MTDFQGEVIRGRDNPVAKFIRSLQLRNTREKERAFVVEGARAVEDSLAAGGEARILLVREDATWRTPRGSERLNMRRMETRLFNSLAGTVSPQPVMAVFEMPSVAIRSDVAPLVLVVDGVQDPGNLGTLLRSAAGAGATSVLLTPGTVDPYNPKVVRAGMGVHFRLPIGNLTREWHDRLVESCPVRALADAGGVTPYYAVDWRRPAAIIVGAEAHGSSEVGRALSNATVSIPLHLGVESLNAGVAGSILLFEAARQRSTG